MKKFLLTLICLILALSLCSIASAEPAADAPAQYTSGNYTYILLPDGTAEITAYTSSLTLFDILAPLELTVPSELDGYAVTSIGDEVFFERDILGNVIIPEGVTSIGNKAFAYCSNLTSVALPDSLTSIGDEAFAHCPFFLTNVTIPEGVTSIGNGAFYFCTALTNVTLPDTLISLGDNAFFNCPLTSVTLPDSLTSVGANPFANCGVTEIIVSAEHPVLEVIDGVLFDKQSKTLICYPLTLANASYEIPQGTLSIGQSAFYFCDKLTTVIIPEGVTSIAANAFYNCRLTSVTLPDSLISIDTNPFVCCTVAEIIVSSEHPVLEVIDGVLFDKQSKTLICYPFAFTNTSYEIPQGTLAIGNHSFSSGFNLTNVVIPESVTFIGEDIFANYHSLTLTVPAGSYAETYAKENNIPYTIK